MHEYIENISLKKVMYVIVYVESNGRKGQSNLYGSVEK